MTRIVVEGASASPEAGLSAARRACAVFRRAVGAAHVVVDEEVLGCYGRSTGPADCRPLAVVYPASRDEVRPVALQR